MKTFTQTSHEPYDRHTYRLYLHNKKVLNFDDYQELQSYWFSHNQIPDYLNVIEVLDKPKKRSQTKGFK